MHTAHLKPRSRNTRGERLTLENFVNVGGSHGGTLLLRSGLEFPRMSAVLDLAVNTAERRGTVVDYLTAVTVTIARWR